MKRKAFLLGFFSVGGQVLILRELVSSFNGDELFIATALFGWLMAVAAGAIFGGRKNSRIRAGTLFWLGALLLPAMIIVTRLCPVPVTDVVGEVIPFSRAALLSIVLMIPIGFISGWLFPVITREEHRPAASIVQVYLFEGIGAFIGGVMIAALIGNIFSTLAMAMTFSVIFLCFYYLPAGRVGMATMMISILIVLMAVRLLIPKADLKLESLKYRAYAVEKVFDTHYGHQAIISQEGGTTLLTDNTVEAVYPDLKTTEDLLLPPLVYESDSKNILFLGRSEFGIMQLADSLPDIKIVALDPRRSLSGYIDETIPFSGNVVRKDDDQVSFFRSFRMTDKYDIIIINAGEPDNYKNSRLLTDHFIGLTKKFLKKDGILFLPTRYDTDRYISPEKKEILALIHNTMQASFRYVHFWPGDMTLFFASDDSLFNLPPDTIFARINKFEFTPTYINENYLDDRLSEYKSDRLKQTLSVSQRINTIKRPLLIAYQAVFRSRTGELDQKILPFLFINPTWTVGIPVIMLFFFFMTILRKRRRRFYGLFLYFTAGFASLSLELICFYLYQSSAGSLFSEMAVLIGVFMLGMALGAYYSLRINKENLEFPALLLLLTAIVLFFATYEKIIPGFQLIYYALFLFTIAVATGSLFVAATDRYYFGRAEANRGAGYALDLIGSSFGALFTVTILLPFIGLQWLLISMIIFIVLTLIGAIITAE